MEAGNRLGLVTGIKSTMAGGRWHGEVDEEASVEQRELIFITRLGILCNSTITSGLILRLTLLGIGQKLLTS